MSPVSPVFHTVVTVSWSQRSTKNDDIHSIIFDIHAFQVESSSATQARQNYFSLLQFSYATCLKQVLNRSGQVSWPLFINNSIKAINERYDKLHLI